MIKCPKCNAENEDQSMFCSSCGAKLEIVVFCPECGMKLAPGAKFCSRCGACAETSERNSVVSGNALVRGNIDTSVTRDCRDSSFGGSHAEDRPGGPLASDNAVIYGRNIDSSIKNNYDGAEIYNGTIYKGPIDQRQINNSITDNSVTTNVFKESAVVCGNCGKAIVKGSPEYHICVSCGKPFCSEHFDGSSMMCTPCFEALESNVQSGAYSRASSACRMATAKGAKNPDLSFYQAVCILEGKKAFVQQKSDIREIVELLKNAIDLEPKAIYWYFLAYVKYDYYTRKFFTVTPDYKQCLAEAIKHGLTDSDKKRLFSLLKVEKPSCL